MSDYPDPEEEYELMYADDLELLRETEHQKDANVIKKKSLPAKRSLNFSSPRKKQETSTDSDKNIISNSQQPLTPLESLDNIITSVNSNKRTVNDLFGDIDDIDFDNVELPTKRQKTEEEVDLELINKIEELKRLKRAVVEPSHRKQTDLHSIYNEKENISLNIPRWPFIPITNSDSERIYVKLISEELFDQSLDVDTHQLSFRESFASTWEEARKILEEKQKKKEEQESQNELVSVEHFDVNNNNLWVEKYKPHSYLDLLSEESVNRTLLHWLHLWDKVVFKKDVKTKEPQQRNSFSKRTGQFQLTNKWKGKKEAEPELDEDGRPHHKVALLCGPPGVGKTTLAHLLARIAGYRPVELNASDERSTEAFQTALQNATLMRSVLDAEKKPNCLILDEIDGAPLPTVELLVRWCTATVSEKGKKKVKSHPLRRPVVAICNDLYATSLRPLRPVALIVHISGVSISRLTARLCRVAENEGLRLREREAQALAARANGDVRAAILLLSFVRANAARGVQLRIEDVENAAIGTKDTSKGLMQALSSVFTVNDRDPNAVLKTVQAAGEYERIADGIFENYLSARVDAHLRIACGTLSWLQLFDAVNSWTNRTQNYSLYGVLPLCLARCYTVLASRSPPKIRFPTQAQEMYRKRLELESVVESVRVGRCAGVTSSMRALRLDVLPLLPHLLAPALRSHNVQLCSESERASLRTCAGALCDYGLQYVQRRTPEGLYTFQLEPDIYRVAFFGTEERARPPPAVRQALAKEQQLEMIRRNEIMTNRTNNKEKSERKNDANSKDNDHNKDRKEERVPNHLQTLQPKQIKKTSPKVHKNFFGRIVPVPQTQRSNPVSDLISSSSVFYQYREGFNNAVRRNVRMRDIL